MPLENTISGEVQTYSFDYGYFVTSVQQNDYFDLLNGPTALENSNRLKLNTMNTPMIIPYTTPISVPLEKTHVTKPNHFPDRNSMHLYIC